jgi:hypothetical protein
VEDFRLMAAVSMRPGPLISMARLSQWGTSPSLIMVKEWLIRANRTRKYPQTPGTSLETDPTKQTWQQA